MQTLHTALGLPPKTFWSLCTFVWHVSTPKKHLLSSESLKMLLFFSSVKYFLLYKWSSFVVERAVFPWEFYNSFPSFWGYTCSPISGGKGPILSWQQSRGKGQFSKPSAQWGFCPARLISRLIVILGTKVANGTTETRSERPTGSELGAESLLLVGWVFIYFLFEGRGWGWQTDHPVVSQDRKWSEVSSKAK